VTGNHEYYANDLVWCEALQKMGFIVLRNDRRTIGDGSASFDLAGVDDWGAHRSGSSDGYDLNSALAGRDSGRACILLAHRPTGFDVATERGVDLQLSGHTHGGQTFPLTALIGLRYPYSAGLYSHGSGKLYVSRGVGFVGPPMRLGSAPELVKVVLTA
jgi:predicted MPP superfamily phosphohydrolase